MKYIIPILIGCNIFSLVVDYKLIKQHEVEIKATECNVRAKERGFNSSYIQEGSCIGEYIRVTSSGQETFRALVTSANRHFNYVDLEAFKSGSLVTPDSSEMYFKQE